MEAIVGVTAVFFLFVAYRVAVMLAKPVLPAPPFPADLFAAVSAHNAAFDHLRTFEEVAAWDAHALELAARCGEWADGARRFMGDAAMVGGGVQAAKMAQLSTTAREQMQRLSDAAELLVENVDLTPNDKAEQKAMLKELRAQKKELQLQKREVKAAATEVRRGIRAEAAQAGRFLFFYDAKMGAAHRRILRAQREALVAPHETAAAALERRIVALERRINWVARFGDAPDEE